MVFRGKTQMAVLRLIVALLLFPASSNFVIGHQLFSTAYAQPSIPSRDEIIEIERDLEGQYEEMIQAGFGADDVLAQLNDPRYLDKAFKFHHRFQRNLDHYLMAKLNYIAHQFMAKVEEAADLEPRLHEKREIIRKMYASWIQIAANRRPRVSAVNKAFRSYFAEVGDFFESLETLHTSRAQKIWQSTRATSIAAIQSSLVGLSLIRLAPRLVKAAWKFHRPPAISSELAGQYPLTPTLNQAARGLAQSRGFQFHYNVPLEEPTPPGALELFVSVHRDIYLDPVIMAHMPGVEGYRIFMAPNRYFPKFNERDIPRYIPPFVKRLILTWLEGISGWLEDRSRRSPDFLPTGEEKPKANGARVAKAGEGIERLKTLLSPTSINRAVIYPEGTGSLIGNLGYVHPSFVVKFLLPLIREGTDLRLRILSYDLPPGLRSSPKERLASLFFAPSRPVEVKVSPSWTSDQIRALSEGMTGMRGKLLPSYLIRAQWLAQLPTTESQLFGQLRLSALEKDVEQYLGRRLSSQSWTHCQSIMKGLADEKAAAL